VLPILLSGCVGTKHLKENEKLLYRQGIQAPKSIDTENMRELFAQQPNRKILALPISPLVGIYYLGNRYYDQDKMVLKKEKSEQKYDAKIARAKKQKKVNTLQFRKQQKVDKWNKKIEDGNTVMQWGEPISVFDSSMINLTLERFQDYLFSKGYFKNQVSHEERYRAFLFSTGRLKDDMSSDEISRSRFVNVRYMVNPGLPYSIDSIYLQVQDTTILKIIQEHQKESFLKPGAQYDQDNFTKERERIDLLLKDFGFYDFNRQYVEFSVDSATNRDPQKIDVRITITDPAKRGHHKQFIVDEVKFMTDAGVSAPGEERKTETYRETQYSYYAENYKLKTLSQRVFLKPGQLYSRSKTLNTQRQLANVDAFKFVNINYDTSGGKFIANIFTSPMSRYEWSNEAGVNVTQGFPGPFYNISFKKRNLFKGMETFDLSGRFGFEGVTPATSNQDVYKSTEAGVNASLTFPQFIWPFNEAKRFKQAQYNPKTRFTAGYAFTDRPEYRRTAISVNGTYSWNNKRSKLYSLTPLSLSVIDTSNLSPSFKDLLQEQADFGNYSLINSFRPSFVNSILFSVTWNHNNYGNIEKNSAYVRAQIESGGTIWNLVDPKVLKKYDLQYYKYLRLSLDVRRVNVVRENLTVAYRFNSGIAFSYDSSKSLPYEKYFFAGGSNSIRAWRPRRLGPGSFKPRTTLDDESTGDPVKDGYFDYSFEQPAEILLEGSIEVRQKLFGFVSGAAFVDFGNVWTFQPRKKFVSDTEVPNGNSQFKLNQFFREIAVGTGVGLRFDFSFLILRLDVGMKVIDPARDEGDRFVLNDVRLFKPYATEREDGSYTNFREPVIYNVGIGYPF
jgi:outer membrane protein insertion porin family